MRNDNALVRAIDAGHKNVRFTVGHDPFYEIALESFPTLSLREQIDARVLPIPRCDRLFRAGQTKRMPISEIDHSDLYDEGFFGTRAYTTHIFRALNAMLPFLRSKPIDLLLVGVPIDAPNSQAVELSESLLGQQRLNRQNDYVTIKDCRVIPDCLGAYATYLHQRNPSLEKGAPTLVIDVGYHRIQWTFCCGMAKFSCYCESINIAMNAFLCGVAESIRRLTDCEVSDSTLIPMIDQAIVRKTPFLLNGTVIPLYNHLPAGDSILQKAAQAIRDAVGSGISIDRIIVTGGGARIFSPWIRKMYPHHDTFEILETPEFANVRGFQLIGESVSRHASKIGDSFDWWTEFYA